MGEKESGSESSCSVSSWRRVSYRWVENCVLIHQQVTYILQSAIIYFILLYGYFSPSARDDGYDVGNYEFSTAMVISAAIVSNLFNGLNTRVWTGWVFFSVFIGIILIWAYTVRPCLSHRRLTRAIVVLTRDFRPSIQSSPLDGYLLLSMETTTSCFDLLSSGLVSLSQSYLRSSRGTSTSHGRSASTPTTWISLIGTTKSDRTWTLSMKPTYAAETRWKTAFWSLRRLAAIHLLRWGVRLCRAAISTCALASARSRVDTVSRKRKMAWPCVACRAISRARCHIRRRAKAAETLCYVPFVIHFVGNSLPESSRDV